MAIWDIVPMENFVVPVLHLQIFLGNDILNNLLGFIESDVEKLSTGEEVARMVISRPHFCRLQDIMRC